MNEDGVADRKSVSAPPDLIIDRDELARAEAANALRQFDAVIEHVEAVRASPEPFKIRPSTILRLNRIALEGINRFAGNYRPSGVYITGSRHQPPPASAVPELVEKLCDYVNDSFERASPLAFGGLFDVANQLDPSI